MLFRFLLRKAKRHKLNQLFSRNLTNRRLMNQIRINIVGRQLRNRADAGLVHNNGVALAVSVTAGIANNPAAEHLRGICLLYTSDAADER